jgi:glycosyltransferase involved in cell wall biosynthesis
MSDTPRILAVTPGAPLAPETFSGTSVALLRALDRRGALAGAVDARTAAVTFAEKAASFSFDLERWKQRFNAGASPISPLARAAMNRVSSARVASAADAADTLLQMTGCSYHDGNLAGFLRRPDLRIRRDSAAVRRALDYERRLYDSVDLIFCMSDRLRRSFLADFEQPDDKVVTVGAGANVTAPQNRPEREYHPARFLFVGKQFERKGGPTVLRAFARLHSERPETALVVVGPTGLSIEQPGVRVVGRISRDDPGGERRIAELYERATAFVMPSLYEPLGVAVIEAMAFGLPCIGSTGGAIEELVEEGVTGFLVEPRDEDALLLRMRLLAESPELCRSLGNAGATRIAERFTWDSVAARMLEAIASRRGG